MKLRRQVLPDEVRKLERAKRERVLAWCALNHGAGHLVATSARFVVLSAAGGKQEWPWDRIIHGQWEKGQLRVTVPDGGRTVVAFTLSEPGGIPAAVRDRVSATMAGDYERTIAGGIRVRFIARRPIGQRDVRWTVMFPGGVDSTDAALRAAADEELAQLKQTLGL